MTDTSPDRSIDATLGRQAADAIFLDGALASQVSDPFTEEFAVSAVERLAEHHRKRAAVYKRLIRSARQSASSQSEHRFQGINEVIQNADDQGSTRIRIGFQTVLGATWLLFGHDGERVDVSDVLPMVLPYLTTKEEEAHATGRFGIGLKTLDRLGNRLEVHSPPYHFAGENDELELTSAWNAVKGLYEPLQRMTLLAVRLMPEVEPTEVIDWLGSLPVSTMLFLHSVRIIEAIDLTTGAVAVTLSLLGSNPRRQKAMALPGPATDIEVISLRASDGSRHWTRYTWHPLVPAGMAPRHKKAPQRATVSLAIPREPAPGIVYVRLPTMQQGWLPFHINADFEPTADRESVQDSAWNLWLVERLGELMAAVAVIRFEAQPRSGWQAVALVPAEPSGYPLWLDEALKTAIAEVRARLAPNLRLSIDGVETSLNEIIYESSALEGIVTAEDLERLFPDRRALPPALRDRSGRWRQVLADLDTSREVTVAEAMQVFSWTDAELGVRTPEFFIALAAAALEAHSSADLPNLNCILAGDGTRIRPSNTTGEALVRELPVDGLAFRLGLARAIHPDYLLPTVASTKVRQWLEQNHLLAPRATPTTTLTALYAKASKHRVELDVESLRLLREELHQLDERREHHGGRIGQVVWVDGFRYLEGRRTREKVHPAQAYQPKSIDKQERQLSWAQAAAETPGLAWIDSAYADTLAAPRRQLGTGPSAFFRLLGVATGPRLESAPRTMERYGTGAYAIGGRALPATQREAIDALVSSVDGLTGDRVSPHLSAVCADMARQPVAPPRRLRARALLAALSRQWDTYRTHLRATAVRAHYALQNVGQVPSTWVADLASRPWMSNQAGEASAPSSLVYDNADNRLVYPDEDGRFAFEVSSDDPIQEELLRVLGIELSPTTADIVDELQALQRESAADRPIDVHRPTRLYQVLAGRAKASRSRRGDLSLAQMRAKFGIDPDRPGLVFVKGVWYSPNAVYLEPAIFGARRPFVPDRPALRPLWDTLHIKTPALRDCIRVLNEIAAVDRPGGDELSIQLDTYRHMEDLIPKATRAEREDLAALPLWTGSEWRTSEPVYAIQQAPDLSAALHEELPMWEFEAPTTLPHLLLARRVTVLSRQQFEPAGLSAEGLARSDHLAELFSVAVGHLRELLAERYRSAYESLASGWKPLEAAEVWLTPDLNLQTTIGGRILEIPARAHVINGVPVAVFFADEEAASKAAIGGVVIASLFPDAPPSAAIDFMWEHAWALAELGKRAKGIRLAETEDTSEPVPDEPAPKRRRSSKTKARTPVPPGPEPPPAPEPIGRELKNFSEGRVVQHEESGDDATPGEVKRRKRTKLKEDPNEPDIPKPPTTGKSYAKYTPAERERAGMEALRIVLRSEGRELRDFRRQRGVGSDLRDDKGKYYELKVSAAELPDDVTLEDSQLKRALREGSNFVLAVVGGVERGQPTKVKLLNNPAERLDLTATNKLSLSGVLSKTGRLYEIETES